MPEPPNSHIAFVPAIAPAIELGEALVVGAIAVLFDNATGDVIAKTETSWERASRIERQVQLDRESSDETQVLKVSDAISCVEEFINAPENLGSFLFEAVKALIASPHTGYAALAKDVFSAQLITCIRKNALPQNSPRKIKLKVYSRKF